MRPPAGVAAQRRKQSAPAAATAAAAPEPTRRKATKRKTVAPKRPRAKRPSRTVDRTGMHYRAGSFWIGKRRLYGVNTCITKRLLIEKPGAPLSKMPPLLSRAAVVAEVESSEKTTLSSYQRSLGGMKKGRYIHGQIRRIIAEKRKAKPKRISMHPMTHLTMLVLEQFGLSIVECEKMVHWSRTRYGTAIDLLCIRKSKKRAVVIELKTGYRDPDDYTRPKYVFRLDASKPLTAQRTVSEQGRHFLQVALTTIMLQKHYPDVKEVDGYVLNVSSHKSAKLYAMPPEIAAMRPWLEAILST